MAGAEEQAVAGSLAGAGNKNEALTKRRARMKPGEQVLTAVRDYV